MELVIKFSEEKLQEIVDRAMEQFKAELDYLWQTTEEQNENHREYFNE